MSEKKDIKSYIAGGYTAKPVPNGGWVVHAYCNNGMLGAFTDYEDLMKWLQWEHEVHAGKSQ